MQKKRSGNSRQCDKALFAARKNAKRELVTECLSPAIALQTFSFMDMEMLTIMAGFIIHMPGVYILLIIQ